MKKIGTIIAYVLIIACIVGIIGFIAVFTRGGTADFKTFYAKYDGQMILDDTDMTFTAGAKNTFEVNYTFDKVTSEKKDFYISVVPYITDDNNFEYTAGGETKAFKDLADTDISGCFTLVKTDSGFTFTVPVGTDMETVLASLYESGTEIEVSDTVDVTETAYFALKLTSYNEKSVIYMPFTVEQSAGWIILTPDGELIY